MATWEIWGGSSPIKIRSPGSGERSLCVYALASIAAVVSSNRSENPDACSASLYTFTTRPEQSMEPSASSHQLCRPPHPYGMPRYFLVAMTAFSRIASLAGIVYSDLCLCGTTRENQCTQAYTECIYHLCGNRVMVLSFHFSHGQLPLSNRNIFSRGKTVGR